MVDLTASSTTCVRFDQNTVYLGAAPANQKCPDHVFGKADALEIEPAAAGASTGATQDATSHQIASTGSGITVSATYSSSPSQITGILASGGLPVPSAGATGAAGAKAAPDTMVKPAAATPVPSSAVTFTGEAFDACSAPSAATMAAWQASSPYGAIGIYIGGANEACSQPNLTASWVATEAAAGWHFFLIYVGLQAPGGSCTKCTTITSPTSDGISAAQDAATDAANLGFGTGTPIVDDMEAYPTTGATSATATVLSFISSWTTELHALGYNSGEYSSLSSGITDLVNAGTGFTLPDVVDFASWNGTDSATDPAIPSGDWPFHQRIHQYSGGTEQTYGGYQIDVDRNYMDLAVTTVTPTTSNEPPAVLKHSNGTLGLYAIRGDGNVWAEGQSAPGAAFGGWQPLSTTGNFVGEPAAIDTANGTTALYARTTSGAIMGASQSTPGGAFSSWGALGTADAVSDPAVILTANHVIAVYVADATGAISGISQSVAYGPFGSWQSLSGPENFLGKPAVIQTSNGIIALYAHATTGTLTGTIMGASQSVPGGAFGSWGVIGTGNFLSDPTVLLTTNHVIAIYAQNDQNGISGISQGVAYGPFGSWQALSGADGFNNRPAVIQTSNGTIALFAWTINGAIMGASQSSPGGAFGSWGVIGGTGVSLTSFPSVIMTSASTIAIYAANASGGISGVGQSVPYGTFSSWMSI